ncbi:Stk1 family PASTA domain-containing Ser/Thr kinase [Clostridium sp. AT4]|uniref:Stk1 family PASTA domain-containing Ser/Thr kinase n=1 Tax=Clostridium sp. AT4 TaxID=1720194 RepID=UPI00083630A5|nr:Stk1 family PASTA domain-containing Ser/Thr kinase [Clostridium sp. AT4]
MLNPGTYLQERYEILEKIGSGGMSVVYKAKCHTLNRLVAIKVLKEEFASDENFVSKFKMEAQAAARLSHPNIVNVYDVVDEENLHYIVMELIEGITLKSYIEKKELLDSKEAIGIAIQVAQGIAAAHEQHIIHRDIKPQNMIISKDGKVKVADFGIARAVSSQTVNSSAAVGSVHYISPEQARGGYCDERSDIYSFGITLYEMVTGRVPFEGDNTVAVALAHLEDPVVPPGDYNPQVYPGLEDIILKCTKKKPDRRYGSMEEVIHDLRRVLMDPECDIYQNEEIEEGGDPYQTRPISKDELSQIRDHHRRKSKETGADEAEKGTEGLETSDEENGSPDSLSKEDAEEFGDGTGDHRSRHHSSRKREFHKKIPSRKRDEDVSTQFERMIAAIGIIAAILVVIVVVFVFSRLTGLFWPGSGQDSQENQTEAVTQSASMEEIQVIPDEGGTIMPNVLDLPRDMAESKLKEYDIVMKVTGEEYSENYSKGYVMRQDVDEGTAVEKWSTVGVTISKGSERVDVKALNLSGMDKKQAEEILKDKDLIPSAKEEANDTVPKGKVIRVGTEEAKAGDTVELFVSSGPKTVQGQVPKLTDGDAAVADALLKAAGLVSGTVTYEYDPSKPHGQVLSQSELPGTMLEPQSAVDYVVNDSAQASTEAAAAKTGEEEKYYVGSIDATCSLSNYIGPASQTSSVRILIRLKQKDPKDANTYVYTNLISPRLVVGSQDIPVVFSRIKGAYGVDSGIVEVVDVDNDDKVIQSWPVSFFPAG